LNSTQNPGVGIYSYNLKEQKVT